MAGISGSGSTSSGGSIYHRSYPKLRLPLVQLAWRAVTVIAALYAWSLSAPWLLIKQFAPSFGVQSYVKDVEDLYFQYATPIITKLQDATYWAFDFGDYWADKALVNAKLLYNNALSNAKHIYNNYLKDVSAIVDQYLGWAETRSAILQDHGLNGIRLAFWDSRSGASAPVSKPIKIQ